MVVIMQIAGIGWILNIWAQLKNRTSRLISSIPHVSWLWAVIILLAFILTIFIAIRSNSDSRGEVSGPLLTGVITLFAISLTVATMGVRVASDRYSYRIKAPILEPKSLVRHFGPHLLAMSSGILLLSTTSYDELLFIGYIFSSILSILSIFPFLFWILQSLTPSNVLSSAVEPIDADLLDNVADQITSDWKKALEDRTFAPAGFLSTIPYKHLIDDDPTDAVVDIVRTRVNEDDSAAAKKLINEYISIVEPLVKKREYRFRSSHSKSQYKCWYLFGPFERIFQVALKSGNDLVAMEVVTMIRHLINGWTDKSIIGVPEVFFEVFGAVTIEYVEDSDQSQAFFIAREYKKVAGIIARDIRSPLTDLTSAMVLNFAGFSQSIGTKLIQEGYYSSARIINEGLRSIVEAKLMVPSESPDREILAIGIIGEKFANEQAKSEHVVHIRNDKTVIDQAEWAIVTLVTFIDKIDETGNGYTFKSGYKSAIKREISRVNSALEERDLKIASMTGKSSENVLEVIRASRLFRGAFQPEDLLKEVESVMSEQMVIEICESLSEIGALKGEEDGKYLTAFEDF